MPRPHIKTCRKRYDASRQGCFFCGERRYPLLDAHRILDGPKGGTYAWVNVLVLCGLCHRKVTVGLIQVHARHQSTLGEHFLHWTDEQGTAHWTKEH